MQAILDKQKGIVNTLKSNSRAPISMKRALEEENETIIKTKKSKISSDANENTSIEQNGNQCSKSGITSPEKQNKCSTATLYKLQSQASCAPPTKLTSIGLKSKMNPKAAGKRLTNQKKKLNQLVGNDPVVNSFSANSMSCLVCHGVYCQKMNHKENFVAIDCEFVGVGPGLKSALARCSIVDWDGYVVCDMYVKPEETITDYRTRWSGVRPQHMRGAATHQWACEIITQHIKDKIVIGHAIYNDLNVMQIDCKLDYVIDTSKCRTLKDMFGSVDKAPVGLKRLSKQLLDRTIQKRVHCSVEDARATMDLFKLATSSKDKKYAGHTLSFNPRNLPETHNQREHSRGPENKRLRQDSGSYMADHYWSSSQGQSDDYNQVKGHENRRQRPDSGSYTADQYCSPTQQNNYRQSDRDYGHNHQRQRQDSGSYMADHYWTPNQQGNYHQREPDYGHENRHQKQPSGSHPGFPY